MKTDFNCYNSVIDSQRLKDILECCDFEIYLKYWVENLSELSKEHSFYNFTLEIFLIQAIKKSISNVNVNNYFDTPTILVHSG